MEDSKPWYLSRTILGALIMFVAQGAKALDLELGPEGAEALVNDLATLAGLLLTIYGRIKAVKRVTAKKESQ